MTPPPLRTHCLIPITGDTSALELTVMNWFAAGHDILWIPIYEVADGPDGIAGASDEAGHFGGPRPIQDVTDFYHLPIGLKGWVFPAHLDDTDVICVHGTPGEISFGHLQHPDSGQRLAYRYDTEAPIRRQALWCQTEREL
jgi:hypothetical protein